MKNTLLALLLVAGIAAALPCDGDPGDPQPSRACEANTGLACRTLVIGCGLPSNTCQYCSSQGRHAGCTGQAHQSCEMVLEQTSCGQLWIADCIGGGCGVFLDSGGQCVRAVCQ